jgi:hypothetical protein
MHGGCSLLPDGAASGAFVAEAYADVGDVDMGILGLSYSCPSSFLGGIF